MKTFAVIVLSLLMGGTTSLDAKEPPSGSLASHFGYGETEKLGTGKVYFPFSNEGSKGKAVIRFAANGVDYLVMAGAAYPATDNRDIGVAVFTANDGKPDPAFNSMKGWQSYAVGTDTQEDGFGVCVDPDDNSLYITGMTFNGTNYSSLVLKLQRDGTKSWNQMKIVSDRDNSVARAIAFHDSHVFASGFCWDKSGIKQCFIAKIKQNGSVVKTAVFSIKDSGGIERDAGCMSMSVVDGKILVSGAAKEGKIAKREWDLFVKRYSADLAEDTNFGGAGIFRASTPNGTKIFANSVGTDIVRDNENRLVIAGYSSDTAIADPLETDDDLSTNGLNVFVVRLTSNGQLDSSFNDDGFYVADVKGKARSVSAAVAEYSNRVHIAYEGQDANKVLCFEIRRINEDGTIDSTFNSGKPLHITGNGATRSNPHDMTFTRTGYILTAGWFEKQKPGFAMTLVAP